MVYGEVLRRLTEMSIDVLGDNLVGVYLHGSAAMGCFCPEKSDLDLILVVEEEIADTVKLEFLRNLLRLNGEAPAKGIELSIVRRKFCRPFVYPTPYELHFSEKHIGWFRDNPGDYIEKMKGTDKDLAAHFTILGRHGIVLAGEKIEEVFGDVPKRDYIDSIWYDVENAGEEILENPMYFTLNLCRVLAYLREDLVLSKKSGGEWGLRALPQKYHAILYDALRCYASAEEMSIDRGAARAFAEDMVTQIRQHIESVWEEPGPEGPDRAIICR